MPDRYTSEAQSHHDHDHHADDAKRAPDQPDGLPPGARWLDRDELWARRGDNDDVEAAAIAYRGTVFSLFDGAVSWTREDDRRTTSFDLEEIDCMNALAELVRKERTSGFGQ